MKRAPIVSVIIPAYGHAHHILETLNSVFSQTFCDFEVIVVNDGSPDDTELVLQDWIASDRIRYVKQSNQGVAAARNHGISIALGHYIALLDDDDLWPEDKLEWQVAALDSSKAVAIGGTAVFLRDGERAFDGAVDGTEQELKYVDLFDGCPFISPGLVLIRKEALDRCGGFDQNIWGADDHDLWFGLACEGNLILRAHPSLVYRCHDSNASLDSHRMMVNSKKVIEKRLLKFEGIEYQQLRQRAYIYLFRWRGALCLREAVGGILRFPPQISKVSRKVHGFVLCFANPIVKYSQIRKLFWAELRAGAADLVGRMRIRSSTCSQYQVTKSVDR